MPITYLWEDEWRTEIPKQLAEKKAKAKVEAERKQQEKRGIAQQEKRTKELATLAELKAKYEQED